MESSLTDLIRNLMAGRDRFDLSVILSDSIMSMTTMFKYYSFVR